MSTKFFSKSGFPPKLQAKFNKYLLRIFTLRSLQPNLKYQQPTLRMYARAHTHTPPSSLLLYTVNGRSIFPRVQTQTSKATLIPSYLSSHNTTANLHIASATPLETLLFSISSPITLAQALFSSPTISTLLTTVERLIFRTDSY